MSDPFTYSMDTDFTSRLEAFEQDRPDFDIHGLTEDQVEGILRQHEELLAAQGVDLDDEIDEPAEDASQEAVEAPVSVSEPVATDSLTPAAARALLVAAGVPVGARGRLSAEQWEKAKSLA